MRLAVKNLGPVLFSLLLAAGCGETSPTLIPVSGTVMTESGEPCDGALVVFHPKEESRVNAVKPFGKTDENGKFALTTFDKDDGAEPGDYGVTIVWNASPKEGAFSLSGEGSTGGGDQLKGRYGDPKNPKLEAIVKPGDGIEFDFKVD